MIDVFDMLALVGLALVGAGVWLLAGPGWTLLVVGGIVLAMGMIGALRGGAPIDDEGE